MSERIIELNEALDTAVFYGVNNRNMLCVKTLHPQVRIVARGYQVKLAGNEKRVDECEKSLRQMEQHCLIHGSLNESQVAEIVGGMMVRHHDVDNLITYGVSGKPIQARTTNQQRLVSEYETNDLLFAIGPAGSGKTFTAIALAVRALKNKQVRKIILSRPAVEAGEKLGFLPGDMREKIDPYLQPLYDALEEMLPQQKLTE